MKLISKIHDYYDTPFQQSASDPKYVFVRESKEFLTDLQSKHFIRFSCESNNIIYDFISGVIGFCGKIYPYLKLDARDSSYFPIKMKSNYFYSMRDLDKVCPDISLGKTKLSNYRRWNDIRKLSDIDRWFKNGTVEGWSWSNHICEDSTLLKFFLKHKVAYFVINGFPSGGADIKIETYPRLKEYEFFKVYDTYLTFQLVEMFLTNDLVKRDDINVKISDVLKAETHGFNKYSFRKDPTRKR